MDGFNLGDLISLIIVFSLYLTAASGQKKKGRKNAHNGKRRMPMRTKARGEQADWHAHERAAQVQAGFDTAFHHESYHTVKASCEKDPIHLHRVFQLQFADASEGEDPCHAGGVEINDDSPFDMIKDTDSEMCAQDVLRGVIMSEILTRPHERAARRQGRR